jgi:diguanylate cyclase (GGDEF)-like protein
MAPPPGISAATLPLAALDRLMPLHVMVSPKGIIVSCGPTVAKLLDGRSLLGQSLFAAFDLRRPSGVLTMADLRAREGEKLRLSLRVSARPLALRGLVMRLADGAGLLLNLSFGIGLADAVRNFTLTDSDFAATDLAVEMLYLVEAKSAAIGALQNMAQRLEGDKQMAEVQASTDMLTGLSNRRALDVRLEGLTAERMPFGLMHVDLDYFKAVNDTLGHAAGDVVLTYVARVLERETRHEDTAARVGGDEFVLVFPGMTDVAMLDSIARRIIEELSQPIAFDGRKCRISASIGIVTSALYDDPTPDVMQADADEALYEAKRAGRARAQLHGGTLARSA